MSRRPDMKKQFVGSREQAHPRFCNYQWPSLISDQGRPAMGLGQPEKAGVSTGCGKLFRCAISGEASVVHFERCASPYFDTPTGELTTGTTRRLRPMAREKTAITGNPRCRALVVVT